MIGYSASVTLGLPQRRRPGVRSLAPGPSRCPGPAGGPTPNLNLNPARPGGGYTAVQHPGPRPGRWAPSTASDSACRGHGPDSDSFRWSHTVSPGPKPAGAPPAYRCPTSSPRPPWPAGPGPIRSQPNRVLSSGRRPGPPASLRLPVSRSDSESVHPSDGPSRSVQCPSSVAGSSAPQAASQRNMLSTIAKKRTLATAGLTDFKIKWTPLASVEG
jgi:hypothetical protein